MFAGLRRKRQRADKAQALYGAIMRQVREPALYAELGVPDTFDGRFDALVLHVALVLRRLRAAGPGGKDLAQAVFDAMFRDMDIVLRERGVADLSVGRKIREMAEAFYGRAKAYEAALAEAGDEALANALHRNVYRGSPGAGDRPQAFAHYVRAADRALAETPFELLSEGGLRMPAPGSDA